MYALVGVVVSTILSGFFSLASCSLRMFRRAQLEEVFEGPRGQERIESLARDLNALRLTSALCRSLSNLAAVLCLLHLFGGTQAGWPAVVGALVAAGGLIALFSVAIPNAWARYAPQRVLRGTVGVLGAFRLALYPIVSAMQALDLPVRRLSGAGDGEDENGELAKQEILQAASEGQADGAVDAEEVEMIESVMEFGQTRAVEIMTPRTDIFALPVEVSFHDATEKIVDVGHTRVPIYQGDLDNIIGVLYAKDLLQHVGGEGPPAELRAIMRKPYFVPETKLLDDLLREFKARKVHLAVVLDEYGGTAGLVTVEDLIEEIVGDISDEYDQITPALMKPLGDRAAEVDGRLRIDDLNDALKLEVPEDEDYDTVAGMVFSELGYIPTVGEKLKAFGAEFAVLAADERRITRLRVEVLQADQAPQGG